MFHILIACFYPVGIGLVNIVCDAVCLKLSAESSLDLFLFILFSSLLVCLQLSVVIDFVFALVFSLLWKREVETVAYAKEFYPKFYGIPRLWQQSAEGC